MATIEGNFTPFVDEYLNRLYKLITFKMLVVVVFDGKPGEDFRATTEGDNGLQMVVTAGGDAETGATRLSADEWIIEQVLAEKG